MKYAIPSTHANINEAMVAIMGPVCWNFLDLSVKVCSNNV